MTSVLGEESMTFWDQLTVDLKQKLFLKVFMHTIMLFCFGQKNDWL